MYIFGGYGKPDKPLNRFRLLFKSDCRGFASVLASAQIENRIASLCMPNKREWIYVYTIVYIRFSIYIYVYIILNARCTNDIYKCFSELIAQLPHSAGTKRVASTFNGYDDLQRLSVSRVCIIVDQRQYLHF